MKNKNSNPNLETSKFLKRTFGIHDEIVESLLVVQQVFKKYRYDFIVTNIAERKSKNAFLYWFDCNVKEISENALKNLIPEIQSVLGACFKVTLSQNKASLQIEFEQKEIVN